MVAVTDVAEAIDMVEAIDMAMVIETVVAEEVIEGVIGVVIEVVTGVVIVRANEVMVVDQVGTEEEADPIMVADKNTLHTMLVRSEVREKLGSRVMFQISPVNEKKV